MISDARSVSPGATIHCDLCIVGAGPAGISVALQFVNTPYQVVLLESGDRHATDSTQRLGKGTNSGLAYYALDECRPRCLGGTTSIWGGWSRPLDPLDFETQDWNPESGWPFRYKDLEPFYRQAHSVCRLDSCPYDEVAPTDLSSASHKRDWSYFQDIQFHIAPTRFGEAYRPELGSARNLDVLLNATVTNLEADSQQNVVREVHVETLARNKFTVRARHVVLAAGGIENARILLLSRNGQDIGLGNQHDLVGRFFADHLHMPVGTVHGPGHTLQAYRQQSRNGLGTRGAMALREQTRRTRKLLGYAATLHNADDPHDVLRPSNHPGYRSALALLRTPVRQMRPNELLRHGWTIASDLRDTAHMVRTRLRKPAMRKFLLGCRAEQSPNPDSRVVLDTQTDAFGMQQAHLQWKLRPQDLQSMEQAEQLLKSELSQDGMEVLPSNSAGDLKCGAHHMGTTRMHSDPKRGVVDADGRVHGVANLHIAGSSVFPTSGWAPPTLTVIALALRLASAVKAALSR